MGRIKCNSTFSNNTASLSSRELSNTWQMTGRISADSDSSSVTVSPDVGPDNSPPPPDLLSLGGWVPALPPSDLLPLQLLPPSGYAGWKDRWFSDHSQLLLSRDSGGPWEGNTAWYFLLSSDEANSHLVILPSFQGGIFLLHYNIWWLFYFLENVVLYRSQHMTVRWHISDHRQTSCKVQNKLPETS